MGYKTPIYPAYGETAKIIDFSGWDLPVQFAGGIVSEHQTVRRHAGLFDVSHMGQITVIGADAESFLDYCLTNTIGNLRDGQIRYSPVCFADGTTVDDVLVYRRSGTDFLVIVNASNIKKDYDWLVNGMPWNRARSAADLVINDVSNDFGLIALQGPDSVALLASIAGSKWVPPRRYWFADDVELAGVRCLISRTGYSGEDGFEIMAPAKQAAAVWRNIIETFGSECSPCGLGARDTLRLEAGLPLYGNELSDKISPLAAGLGRFVDFTKAGFCGKDSLQKGSGGKSLVGLEMIDRGVPRHGYEVVLGDRSVGQVTSGAWLPTVEKFCAMAIVDNNVVGTDVSLGVAIRNSVKSAKQVKIPFYTRGKPK